MPASYTYQTGYTVASSYSWDNGIPFSSNTPLLSTPVTLNSITINGRSPGAIIYFNNTSTSNAITGSMVSLSTLYIWNFGDYYNLKSNTTTLTCASAVSHVYIMPGNYTVTLTQIETLSSSTGGILPLEPKISTNNSVLLDDIKPTALMHSVTPLVYGDSPHRVQITARGSTPGSFPIDRIDWDLDDGSPIVTISRYTSANNSNITFTNAISGDPKDPRNYDISNTYKLTTTSFQTFYPSITAYSSSTNTFDTCSLTIGPISPPVVSGRTHLLKARNIPQGKIYGLQINNNIALLTTLSSTSTVNSTVNTPTNIIKDSYNSLINNSINGNIGGTDYYSITAVC
jgi:hypothetical protein